MVVFGQIDHINCWDNRNSWHATSQVLRLKMWTLNIWNTHNLYVIEHLTNWKQFPCKSEQHAFQHTCGSSTSLFGHCGRCLALAICAMSCIPLQNVLLSDFVPLHLSSNILPPQRRSPYPPLAHTMVSTRAQSRTRPCVILQTSWLKSSSQKESNSAGVGDETPSFSWWGRMQDWVLLYVRL